jgi:ribosome biogenesis GTPase / thiamine phosphate phosphatase
LNPGLTGLVVATHGRHFVVRGKDAERIVCVTRGKKAGPACGDQVRYISTAPGQGAIDSILPRSNLFYRSDAIRTKLLAANLTQLCTVVGAEPPFSEDLLGRSLVAAEATKIAILIVLNKIDLHEPAALARERLAPYRELGYCIVEVSLKSAPAIAIEALTARLGNETTVLVGQSGMGKSSLLNRMVPDAQAATREISEALHSGKHTTTDARLYFLPGPGGTLIDTPGFQEFGLAHLTPGEIERAFPELRAYLGRCKFYNCTHLIEPGCAVREALAEGHIAGRRYDLFATLTRESRAATHASPSLG